MTKKSLVPDSFQLGGMRWKVIRDPGLTDCGHADSEASTITLRSGLEGQLEEWTFFHELVHAIKFAMGLQEHNEQEVDAFAVFLHQYMLTRK